MSKFPTPYKWYPSNPDKYVGDVNNIVVRSSWEKKVMIRFDTDPSVLKWNSEGVVIPYINPIDKKPHRYFPDFIIMCRTASGEIRKSIVEVKPYSQTVLPKVKKSKSKKTQKTMLTEISTYAVNRAKFDAAEEFCAKNNMDFVILSEADLGITKK